MRPSGFPGLVAVASSAALAQVLPTKGTSRLAGMVKSFCQGTHWSI